MEDLITYLKANSIFLYGENGKQIYNYVDDKINVNNVAAVYYSSHVFNVSGLLKLALCFIERSFSLVSESQKLLDLDYSSIANIFSSNELNIDSELEVIYLAERWLSHKKTERSKYAKDILFRTRLSLLSVHALNYILEKKSYFVKNSECADIIQNVISSKEKFHSNKNTITSRYCNQNNFNIILCGGDDGESVVRDVYNVDARCSYNVNKMPQMKEGRHDSQVVCIKNEIYVFGGCLGGFGEYPIMSIEKYSSTTKTWDIISHMYDDRHWFSACSFMGNVFVVAGIIDDVETDSCIEFNAEHKTWREIASMNQPRYNAACAVFEGKLFVSGGNNDRVELNTVEAYDHVANEWSYMPKMIIRRENHKSVAIKNKLFVVGGCSRDGGKTCEVFDSTCNMFLLLKPNLASVGFYFSYLSEVIALGSKLVVFSNYNKNILCYDLEFDKWSEIPFEVTYYLKGFHCAKLPQLYHANEVNII